MLYSEIIAVCSQILTKHINTLCGQNVEYLCFKGGGTYSYHRVLKKINTMFLSGFPLYILLIFC
jgi:hypothetical protein